MGTKNVTLRLDELLLKQCRKLAVDEDKSLSAWLTDLIKEKLRTDSDYEKARKRAIELMEEGFNLGGPLSREEIYDR